MKRINAALLIGLLALAGCKGNEPAPGAGDSAKDDERYRVTAPNAEKTKSAAPMPLEETEEEPADDAKPEKKRVITAKKPRSPRPSGAFAAGLSPEDISGSGENEDRDEGGAISGAESRSWFPETFLFEPLVVTDENGKATVKARVPDRLTSWRVLALAHSRGGKQAGATTSFLGTLPSYVDVIAPPSLRVGDRALVPVQAVNTTDATVRQTLSLSAVGAKVSGGKSLSLAGASSQVVFAELSAKAPGEVQLSAKLGTADAVTKRFPVVPTGRPLVVTRSGTLSKARDFRIEHKGEKTSGVAARVLVYSGARALLSSELAAAGQRQGVSDDAFGLLLIGKAPELLKKLGAAELAGDLRDQRLVLTQRIVRHARRMELSEATLLAQAAALHPDDPILASIALRAVSTIRGSQLPDGTCGGASGWPLQRLLATTAECVRAAKDDRQVVIRGQSAFERHANLIDDPYTAASVLATNSGSDATREKLEAIVAKAAVPHPGGGKLIRVPGGVLRADGRRPSDIEATALAALAVRDPELKNELGTVVLGSYSPSHGWGDGRANLVCMEAVLELFSKPLPSSVSIALTRDGKEVARGTLDPKKAGEVFVLESRDPKAAGSHSWSISAEPAIPGLAFSLSTTTHGEWPAVAKGRGIELKVEPPKDNQVGKASFIRAQVLAPVGPFSVEVALPAGVTPDSAHLESLVQKRVIVRYELSDGHVTLHGRIDQPGKAFSVRVRVIPTLGGELSSGPVLLRIGGKEELFLRPSVWKVSR